LAKAAILVPSPNVAEDHQTKNARALSDRDAAVFVSDAEAGAKLVGEALKLVADADRRHTLEGNIGKMALKNSAEQIAQRVISIAQQKQ
jgi:UDP-N-acetylglucosamine--N-acetylmuramyl-(pentapeptide) pyrophosphoryl-undecaprenol N-acetylglucosamine transferase